MCATHNVLNAIGQGGVILIYNYQANMEEIIKNICARCLQLVGMKSFIELN
jgi:hypothetical protein